MMAGTFPVVFYYAGGSYSFDLKLSSKSGSLITTILQRIGIHTGTSTF
jgi:hypothetical protein